MRRPSYSGSQLDAEFNTPTVPVVKFDCDTGNFFFNDPGTTEFYPLPLHDALPICHDGIVGMNLLTKVQLPNLPTLYGAMLAGVDYILMGAGIPREIPGALDAMKDGREARLRFEGEGDASATVEQLRFDPAEHAAGAKPPELARSEE